MKRNDFLKNIRSYRVCSCIELSMIPNEKVKVQDGGFSKSKDCEWEKNFTQKRFSWLLQIMVMKSKTLKIMKNLLLITATIFLIQVCYAQTDSFDDVSQIHSGNTSALTTEVTGPYFGQTPPGNTPQLFAPEVLAHPADLAVVTRIAFSPDGMECFFSGPTDLSFSNTRMYHTKCVDSVWTPLELLPFFPGFSCRQPFFATNDTLYVNSNSDIYLIVRTSQGWGTPQVLPEPINSSSYDGMYTQSMDGTAYIESSRPGGKGGIDVYRVSPLQAGLPRQIQNLGVPINTTGDDNDPVISPDGRYLIFGSNYNDLFITFSKGNGSWTAPINLNVYYPGLNTSNQEYAPYISSDGRYLFFSRWNAGGIYWVSTKPIDSLSKPNFPPYVKNPIPNQTSVTDSSFNYQIPDSTFIDDDGNNTLTYSATMSDGNLLPSWLHFEPSTRTFSGIPNVTSTINIKVTATDTANASASCTFNIIGVITEVGEGKKIFRRNLISIRTIPILLIHLRQFTIHWRSLHLSS